MNTLYIILGLLVLLAVYLVSIYNRLVTLRLRVKEAFADIDVQLKKRYDLLPDLVETAKRAIKLDEDLLTKITALRSQAMTAHQNNVSPEEQGKIESQLSNAVSQLRVQVEAYPDIKSHQELLTLMDKTTEIEEKISYARRFYNTQVLSYNTSRQQFPVVLFAETLGFSSEKFFEADESERADVKVDFSESKAE